MKFDLVRPCGNCPFRTDLPPYLRPGRVREILGDPAARGRNYFPAESFLCHKTVPALGAKPGGEQHCAGAALILTWDYIPNTAMQLAERLLGWDAPRLDQAAPVYPSRRACIRAHVIQDEQAD